MKKELGIIRDSVISGMGGLLAGASSANLLSNYGVAGGLNSAVSTVASYLSDVGIFLRLHAKNNKDLYGGGENFDSKKFILNQVKMSVGYSLVTPGLLFLRGYIANKMIEKGISPEYASVYSDMIIYPVRWLASGPISRIMGVTKKKNLESIVEN